MPTPFPTAPIARNQPRDGTTSLIHGFRLRRWAGALEAHGGRLIVAGVTPAADRILERGGLVDVLGADGIVPATDRVFGALDEAVARGRAWIAARS